MKKLSDLKPSIFLLTVTIGVLLFFGSCGQKTDTAIRFEMEKMMTDADRLSRKLSIKGPSLSEADLNILVEAYTAITLKIAPPGDSQEASDASEAKREAWALASMANTRVGVLYLGHKLYDKAVYHFETVINNPATSDLQKNAITNYIALTMERAGRYLEAAAYYDSLATGYRKTVELNSPNLDALDAPIKAAEMSFMAGDREGFRERLVKARAYYEDLIGEYPDSPLESAAIGKMAASYLKQRRFAEAIDILESTRDESTGFISPNILMTIANIYMNNIGDFRKAEQTYRQFISSHPDNKQLGTAYLGLGLSLFRQRLFAESRMAVGDIEKLPDVSQEAVQEANYLIALSHDKEGNWELCKGQLDYIQLSFPGTDKAFEAALYIANHYRSKEQTELARKAYYDAEKYISRYVDQTGTNPVSASQAMGYLVRCYEDQEDYDKAAQTLTQLYQNFQQLPEGRFAPLKLADLYENAIYDTAKAVYWLRAFVDDNPENDNLETLTARIRRLEAATGE